MEPKSVGIRAFRENMAAYVLQSSGPVTITKNGEPVGLFIPAKRRKRTEAEKLEMEELALRIQADMASKGVTEEDVIADLARIKHERHETFL